jgi:ADP-ribose pyrophosphatase
MKITAFDIVAKLRFVTLFAVSYLDRKGNAKQWHMVGRGGQPKSFSGEIEHPDAAIIVPYLSREQKLVVIREFRIPVGGYQYGFPAGLLDKGEELAAAAGRELYEETGLEVIRVYRTSPAIFSSAGITDESIAMVFAEAQGVPSTLHNEDSEDISIFAFDQQGIRDLLARRDLIFGARAWLVMDAFARFGPDYFLA